MANKTEMKRAALKPQVTVGQAHGDRLHGRAFRACVLTGQSISKGMIKGSFESEGTAHGRGSTNGSDLRI